MMPDPTADLRARIAAALREHQPPTHVDSAGLPADEFDCCADAVMAVLDEAFPPRFALAADSEITPEQAEAWQAARDEALGADEAGPHRFVVAPPNAVVIRRRTPEQRRAYLTDNRDEALANGIPADLIDMLIADAESSADDIDPDVCADCYGVGYDIGAPEQCTTCEGSGLPPRRAGGTR
jgi:hypothetical protein